MKNISYLITSLFVTLAPIIPAGAENPGVRPYERTASCTNSTDAEAKLAEAPLSALSGYRVGPGVARRFKRPDEKILRPFFSDGCSVSPDGLPFTSAHAAWRECCVAHDLEYWIGGTHTEQQAADERLDSCITAAGFPRIADLYRTFVGLFGTYRTSQAYRWGYGWNYQRQPAPLTQEEVTQVYDLYGVDRETFVAQWLKERSSLKLTCDTYDPVFRGFSQDEREIYQVLNETLQSDTTITEARAGYFNLERREYLIQLEACPDPVIFVFRREPSAKPTVIGSCSLLPAK